MIKLKDLHTVKINPAEKLTLIYILITFIIGLYLWITTGKGVGFIGIRLVVSSVIIGVACYFSSASRPSIHFFRYLFIGYLFVYWYPETFYINRFFRNFDFLLAGADHTMFGFQPSLHFAQVFPQHWFSELMNLGYLSFFPILIFTCLYFYYTDRKFAEFFFFTITLAFFLFYILFLLFPASGPQYYFQLIDSKQISEGVFPPIGDYYSQHYVNLKSTPSTGIFKQSLDFIKSIAERPTGAFPSSHIGNTTLVLILLASKRKYKLIVVLLPLYFLLVLSTVFTQAHYVVDLIGGFAAAFIFYPLSKYVYPFFADKKQFLINIAVKNNN